MKTQSLRLAAFILLLAMLASATGCKKETNSITESCRVVSQLYYDGNTPGYTLYKYDEQGRIEATIGNQIYARITYHTDSAYYADYHYNGTLNNDYWMHIDSRGRFTTQGGRSLIYNADDKVIREDAGTVLYEYTWQDGDMVSSLTTINGVPSYEYTYTYYTDRENKARWDYNHSGINCFFGKASKHLIKNIKTEQLSNGSITETNWTYEFNEKGLPSLMTILFVNQGSFTTYHYAYECE